MKKYRAGWKHAPVGGADTPLNMLIGRGPSVIDAVVALAGASTGGAVVSSRLNTNGNTDRGRINSHNLRCRARPSGEAKSKRGGETSDCTASVYCS